LNFGQTTWDKTEVLLGTSRETNWELEEPLGNTMGKHWEQGKKTKKSLPPSKRKYSKPLMSAYGAFSLAA
jgi:hypothetical protein